jgi:hypothetical protein
VALSELPVERLPTVLAILWLQQLQGSMIHPQQVLDLAGELLVQALLVGCRQMERPSHGSYTLLGTIYRALMLCGITVYQIVALTRLVYMVSEIPM